MAAQTGIATGLSTPGVTPPTINLQLPNYGSLQMYGPIPRVKSTEEAIRYPANKGNEDVLFDENDPQIAYFRTTDQNGFTQVDRRRCIPEPELTAEEKADQRYLSRSEFTDFISGFNSFREEMIANVRELTESVKSNIITDAPNNFDNWASYYSKQRNSVGSNAGPNTGLQKPITSFDTESKSRTNVSSTHKSKPTNATAG